MKYADLDDKAKTKAREWMAGTAFNDSCDWDHIYTDAVEVGALMGIQIASRAGTTHGGKTYTEPDINFSGFCSQGDGACYSGTLHTEDMAGAVEKVKAEYQTDEVLHALALDAETIHGLIAVHAMADALCPVDEVSDSFIECYVGMHITITGSDHRGFSTKATNANCPEDIDKLLDDFVDAFATWIYDQLEAEHDYQTSDEATVETIEANDYDFDEYGNTE